MHADWEVVNNASTRYPRWLARIRITNGFLKISLIMVYNRLSNSTNNFRLNFIDLLLKIPSHELVESILKPGNSFNHREDRAKHYNDPMFGRGPEEPLFVLVAELNLIFRDKAEHNTETHPDRADEHHVA